MTQRDRQPLTIQPDWLDDSLGLAELLVLARLDSYWRNKHTAYPSDDFLAQQTGRTVRTVQRAVAHLEELGWVSRETETNYQSRGGKRRQIFRGEKLRKLEVDDADDVYLNATGGGKVPATGGGGELKRESKSGRGGSRSRAPTQGTRIPEDFSLTDERLYCAISKGLSRSEAEEELEKFLDYWRAVPGQKGRKADWDATWRNWVRNAVKFRQPPKHNGHQAEDPFDGCINRDRWEGPQ